MDYEYIEKELINLYKNLYGDYQACVTIYGRTDNHSSGFNKLDLYYNGDKLSSIDEEDVETDINNLEYLAEVYDCITLDKEYAFYGKFVTWQDIELAFKGDKEIDLMRI